MYNSRRLYVLVTILSCFLQAQGADKYTDENRPYEFGFNIEGEQHRHEKKDENGLIMGEFGFITADGVYHVTVYATDENGNFKILSMKNIRVKPYPTAPERQGHSLQLPAAQPQPAQQPVAPAADVPGPVAAAPARTCSSCSIPTTTKQRPPFSNAQAGKPNYPPQSAASPNYSGSNAGNPPHGVGSPNYPAQNPQGPSFNNPKQNGGNNYPQGSGGSNYPGPQEVGSPNSPAPGGNGPQTGGNPNYPPSNSPSYSHNPEVPSNQNLGQPPAGERNPKQYDSSPEQPNGPQKPTLTYAQMQIVDKNTDIHKKGPNEKDGLPDGITKTDMMRLLYTFNYTVGFHGHFEEGYTNGAKQGYYFVTGRNGVRTRVDYVADEKGFRPKITQEVLDLLSDDVPKPETEKDEKYGLKGYEFKWLYYPADS